MALFIKECRRFIKVWQQTLVAPSISALLFLSIFYLSIGRRNAGIYGAHIDFITFVSAGLIAMSMAQNAFSHTSSSITISKFQQDINDILMAPISNIETTLAYLLGGVARGVVTSLILVILFAFFTHFHITFVGILIALLFVLLGSFLMSTVGFATGIWAKKFEQVALVTNFVIMPLTFLSGTFYPINVLPHALQIAAYFDPFFFIISGFRYGLTGYLLMDPHILIYGTVGLIVLNGILFASCYILLKKGIGLKS